METTVKLISNIIRTFVLFNNVNQNISACMFVLHKDINTKQNFNNERMNIQLNDKIKALFGWWNTGQCKFCLDFHIQNTKHSTHP